MQQAAYIVKRTRVLSQKYLQSMFCFGHLSFVQRHCRCGNSLLHLRLVQIQLGHGTVQIFSPHDLQTLLAGL